MSAPKILVVDSDEGFGFMLREGLTNTGHYTASWVATGSEALQAIVDDNFELVIVDVSLTDMSPERLIHGIRHLKNNTKIMMTPMIGQDLPKRFHKLELDGVLPKPFFVGDLPDFINRALGRSPGPVSTLTPTTAYAPSTPASAGGFAGELPAAVDSVTPALSIPAVPQETVRYLRASESEILRLLSDLNREVRAEAILVIAGVNLIAQAGMLGREQCEELALLVAHSSQAAAQAACFLGERAGRFTQSLHEGGAYRLYTLTLSDGILLSLALSTNVPLGMIRHQCRQIAEKLSKYII